MSESGFSINVRPKSLEDGLKIIYGFRKIYSLEEHSMKEVGDILAEYIGNEFASQILKEFSSKEDLEDLSNYIPNDKVGKYDLEHSWKFCNSNPINKNIIWLEESEVGELDPYDICPTDMTLHMPIDDKGQFNNYIELDFNADMARFFKAAILSKAFHMAGYQVIECTAWNDLQDEEEWDEE